MNLSPQSFATTVVAWAQKEFSIELSTDFIRARRFNGVWSKEQLETLLNRSDCDLEILARILPFGVFSEDPASYEARKRLSREENSVLLKLRDEYDLKCRENFTLRMQHAKKLLDRKNSLSFRDTCSKAGAQLTQIADIWNWQITGASIGEWGLWTIRKDIRLTIGLQLNRAVEARYWVSVARVDPYIVLRTHEDFLQALGIGFGAFNVPHLDKVLETLREAVDFGKWHIEEYARLLNVGADSSIA